MKMHSYENQSAKKSWNHTPSSAPNPFQTRPFDIQTKSEQSSSLQETVDLDAQYERAKRYSNNLANLPVVAPGMAPPQPPQMGLIQAQMWNKPAPIPEPFAINNPFVQRQVVEKKEHEVSQQKSGTQLETNTIPQRQIENNTGMPDNLKAGIENLSGISMDDVKVHYNSSTPAQLSALAYAQGTDIYVGQGQEKYLPHEAWHVVQQKQGRVQPSIQMKGVIINNDPSLEQEADVMGAQALKHVNNIPNVAKPSEIKPYATHPQSEVVQAAFVYKDSSLAPYLDKIRQYLQDNHTEVIMKSFETLVKSPRNYKFDTWAKRNSVDWQKIFREKLGFDPDWEDEIFKKRMVGHSLSGFMPQHPDTKEKMLKEVPRSGAGHFDYTQDEDHRVLQLLREISTQLYLYLEVNNELAEGEQEIQTMWTHGNLVVGSNNLGTVNNFYKVLSTLKGSISVNQKLYDILIGEYSPKKFLGEISERVGQKIDTLYQGIREHRVLSPQIQEIVKNLINGSVGKITDLKDDSQIQNFTTNSGNIYLLAAESVEGFSHAEQRLIEFRNIVHAYQQNPKAWVAGKKRPCFGCWIREILTNEEAGYKLVYQDEPGKAFMNTYRSAPPKEKKKWKDTLKDKNLSVHESKVGRGEIGPESDSEAEDTLGWDDANQLMDDIEEEKLEGNRLKAVKSHFNDAGQDFDKVKTYLRKRKASKEAIDEREEDNLERTTKAIKLYATASPNPALRRVYSLKNPYKKRKLNPKNVVNS